MSNDADASSDELKVGDIVVLDVSGEHDCGAALVFRGEARFVDECVLDGVVRLVFELDPPLVCACGREIGMYESSAYDIDADDWERRLADG